MTDATPSASTTSPTGQDAPTGADRGTAGVIYQFDSTPRKIKNFSGSVKMAPGEVDYCHWSRAVTRVLEDKDLTESRKRAIILQSLTGKAEDDIDLYRQESLERILEVMGKLYGNTADGHELLANFYQQVQSPSQSTSDYCSTLYRDMCEIIKAGVVRMDEMPLVLLRQFVRGTSDEEVVNKLQLEDHLDRKEPIAFPDLLNKIRTQEARRTEKKLRLRKTVKLQTAKASVETPEDERKQEGELEALRRRIAELEAEQSEVHMLAQKVRELEQKKSRIFCYRCGVDGHIASRCMNDPNPTLVEEKMKQRRSRRPGNWSALPQPANVSNRK